MKGRIPIASTATKRGIKLNPTSFKKVKMALVIYNCLKTHFLFY